MEHLNRNSANVVSYPGGNFRERIPGRGVYSCITPCGLKRLAQRYEYGLLKYGAAEGYQEGLPVKDSIDSVFRHLVSYMDGDNSEDHMAAIAWGALCIMHTEEHHPEMQDIESRKEFRDFNYIQKYIDERKESES